MKELLTIQSKLNAPKGQYNSFGKYKYRSCEDILAAVKPLLAETETTLTITDDIVSVGGRVYVRATVTLKNSSGESESTTAFAREEDTKKGMDASQVTGAASSYARKYALNGIFAIDDTKDSDATNTHGQEPKGKKDTKALTAKAVDEIMNTTMRSEYNAVWNYYATNHPEICAQGGELYNAALEKGKQLPQ